MGLSIMSLADYYINKFLEIANLREDHSISILDYNRIVGTDYRSALDIVLCSTPFYVMIIESGVKLR